MAYADVLFLDDCSDDPDEFIGHDIDQTVRELADPATRKAAMHALSAHPYASDDLVNSPAWPAFCSNLSTLLADSDAEVSSAAVAFAEKVFREVRGSKPLELADLCLALAGHVASTPAPCDERGTILESTSAGASTTQPCTYTAQETGDTASDRAAVRAAAVKLLLRCLQALPRVWATFRDPLLQQLWDAVCPLLKLHVHSSPDSSMQQPDHSGRIVEQQRMRHSAAASSGDQRRPGDGPSLGDADCRDFGGSVNAAKEQRLGAPRLEGSGELCGPLVELCSAEGWSGDWWKVWTAPARPARWLPGALQKHGVLPGLLGVCARLADSADRCREAGAAEAFAVQLVGSVLALSLGRRLFPISCPIFTVLPQQVTVQDAIMCLSHIGTHPLRADASEAEHDWTAAKVSLDALQLLCRDDSPDFRILAQRNVLYLASELELAKQSTSRDSCTEEVFRRLECMMALLARTAYGRNRLSCRD